MFHRQFVSLQNKEYQRAELEGFEPCARNATELLIKRSIASAPGGCYLDVARLSENIKEEGEGSAGVDHMTALN